MTEDVGQAPAARGMQIRQGTWPGGFACALTIGPETACLRIVLPLDVWTLRGQQTFVGYLSDQVPGNN
jgi:hypothetical protein